MVRGRVSGQVKGQGEGLALMPGGFSHQKATAKRSDQKLTPSMVAASGSTKGLSGAQMSATEMVRRAKA